VEFQHDISLIAHERQTEDEEEKNTKINVFWRHLWSFLKIML